MPKRRPAKVADARAAERSAVQASLAAAESVSTAILLKKKKNGSQGAVTSEDVVEALRAMNVRAATCTFFSMHSLMILSVDFGSVTSWRGRHKSTDDTTVVTDASVGVV